MHFKEFLKVIHHRFCNAEITDTNLIQADLINWADEKIGKMLYTSGEAPTVTGVECYIKENTYKWGEPITETVGQNRALPEIISIIRGLLESKNQMEIIEDDEADNLVQKLTTPQYTTTIQPYKKSNTYNVVINVTFSGVINSATLDSALSEFKDRLKFPNNVQYKIIKESVEIDYR